MSRNCYLKVQRDVTQKVSIQELWFLRSARHLMLINICMKFHEDILNAFKVTERTWFCLRNCYLRSSKGHNSKSINTRVMVLAFCTSSNVVKYLYEGILKSFWVTERTRPYHKIYYFQFQRAITPKICNPESRVLVLCKTFHVALHLCKVSWKYLKWFLSYRADTILWQTDGWTDRRPGQKQYVSQPYGGET